MKVTVPVADDGRVDAACEELAERERWKRWIWRALGLRGWERARFVATRA